MVRTQHDSGSRGWSYDEGRKRHPGAGAALFGHSAPVRTASPDVLRLPVGLVLMVLGSIGPLPAAEAPADEYAATGQFPEEKVDADGDGVPDIDDNCPATVRETRLSVRGEVAVAIDACGCPVDPCTCDEDADGVGDCADVCLGTFRGHRIGADGCPLPLVDAVRVRLDVKFEFDKAELQPEFEADLLTLRDTLQRFPDLTVVLEGHTDDKGRDDYNQRLSERRALAARDFLLRDGAIVAERVAAVGYGESRPVADNSTEAGQALNRRTVAEVSTRRVIVPANDQPPPLGDLQPEVMETPVESDPSGIEVLAAPEP